MYNKIHILIPLLGFTLAACGGDEKSKFDQAKLAQYRSVVPSKDKLSASAPSNPAKQVSGNPAFYPAAAVPIATAINGAVGTMIDLLEHIVQLEPSVYNSETKEFFWGPYPNDKGVGYVGVYIREAPVDHDFKFEYAFVRGIGKDTATMKPIIWGGGTPDPTNDDFGVGVTLWDMQANNAFDQEHDASNYDPETRDHGRFVALFASGPDEHDAAAVVTWIVSAFRNVQWKDEVYDPQGGRDADYLYGRYEKDGNRVDFIELDAEADVSPDAHDGIDENIKIRVAFYNEGVGRAEASAEGGSIAAGEHGEAVECWDAALDQTYLKFEQKNATATISSLEIGLPEACGAFNATLDSLNIPSLALVTQDQPDLMNALDYVATNGVPLEQ